MCNCQRHSIHCILPDYLMGRIAEKGSDRLRALYTRARSTDNTMRAMRATLAAAVPLQVRQRQAFNLGASKQRSIYTAGNAETIPGTLVRGEGGAATGDPAADEAYDGLGATWDFFWDVFGRNSIDDIGKPLLATVHYGEDYANAFWNGRNMVFGDGDGELFNRFTLALDVIGHELAHGVTEDETGLVYFKEPGALNEHLSDVWGSLIKQRVLGQTAARADWLIGAGLFTDTVQGVALRSMSAPGTAFNDPILGRDRQPAHMRDYVETWEDNGGVHINSGIPNKAFYLAATTIGGYAWEIPGKVWYAAIRDPRVTENTSFGQFAGVTVDLAGRLPGLTAAHQQAIADAWAAVGVEPTV